MQTTLDVTRMFPFSLFSLSMYQQSFMNILLPLLLIGFFYIIFSTIAKHIPKNKEELFSKSLIAGLAVFWVVTYILTPPYDRRLFQGIAAGANALVLLLLFLKKPKKS